MFRVTTNGSLRMYKSNLMQTTNGLNNAMTKLMTQRNFNSYATDPAAATRAFKIHSSLNATNVQASNNESVLKKYETAWKVVDLVRNDLTTEMGQVPALEGLNDAGKSELNSQGQILRNGAEAMIQSMNSQYNNEFLFGGLETEEVPFEIRDGEVYYRGIAVDSNDPKLDEMNNEHQYVDIGLGFKKDNAGNIIDSTAFDASLSGIEITGYGTDADGDPKNLASIMLRLADIFEGYNEETGAWTVGSEEEANRLVNKFNAARDAMTEQHSSMTAEAKFLETNGTQLNETFDSLNAERSNIEDIDTVDAILELSWAQTCYNAALQVGTSVIPQSLIDYLR